MLIGNPDKIAFLIERVADWETEDFMNGLFYVFVNGKIYPSSLRTATLNSELYSLLDSYSPLIIPAINEELYKLNSRDLFICLNKITFPADCDVDNDYKYLIPFHELNDAGYCMFLISSANHVRFLVGKWNKRVNHHVFTEEVEISKNEMDCLRIQLQNFYQNNCGS